MNHTLCGCNSPVLDLTSELIWGSGNCKRQSEEFHQQTKFGCHYILHMEGAKL